MQTKPRNSTVLMPDDSHIHVTYYCNDAKLNEQEKEKLTNLIIQLHDCICSVKIDKEICKSKHQLETIVNNKVINAKGHLC